MPGPGSTVIAPAVGSSHVAPMLPGANTGQPHFPPMPGPYPFTPFSMPYLPNPFSFYPFYPQTTQAPDGGPGHPVFSMHGQSGGFSYSPMVPGPRPASPVKVQLPRAVSLDEFCHHYAVEESDKEQLRKLRFSPGDRRVEKLEREDWHSDAGFSKLAWEDFLAKHQTFLRDMQAGCWV